MGRRCISGGMAGPAVLDQLVADRSSTDKPDSSSSLRPWVSHNAPKAQADEDIAHPLSAGCRPCCCCWCSAFEHGVRRAPPSVSFSGRREDFVHQRYQHRTSDHVGLVRDGVFQGRFQSPCAVRRSDFTRLRATAARRDSSLGQTTVTVAPRQRSCAEGHEVHVHLSSAIRARR